eukprot:jgi/Botrbrau1/9951/Bobra.0012s0046.1
MHQCIGIIVSPRKKQCTIKHKVTGIASMKNPFCAMPVTLYFAILCACMAAGPSRAGVILKQNKVTNKICCSVGFLLGLAKSVDSGGMFEGLAMFACSLFRLEG